jgi:hypothetical protein
MKTSGLISPRYWSNLPAGEVFITPATVDGTFVCDAKAGDHFNGKYGDLQMIGILLQFPECTLLLAILMEARPTPIGNRRCTWMC